MPTESRRSHVSLRGGTDVAPPRRRRNEDAIGQPTRSRRRVAPTETRATARHSVNAQENGTKNMSAAGARCALTRWLSRRRGQACGGYFVGSAHSPRARLSPSTVHRHAYVHIGRWASIEVAVYVRATPERDRRRSPSPVPQRSKVEEGLS